MQSDYEPRTQFEFCLPLKANLRVKSVSLGISLSTFYPAYVGSQMVPVSEAGLVVAL